MNSQIESRSSLKQQRLVGVTPREAPPRHRHWVKGNASENHASYANPDASISLHSRLTKASCHVGLCVETAAVVLPCDAVVERLAQDFRQVIDPISSLNNPIPTGNSSSLGDLDAFSPATHVSQKICVSIPNTEGFENAERVSDDDLSVPESPVEDEVTLDVGDDDDIEDVNELITSNQSDELLSTIVRSGVAVAARSLDSQQTLAEVQRTASTAKISNGKQPSSLTSLGISATRLQTTKLDLSEHLVSEDQATAHCRDSREAAVAAGTANFVLCASEVQDQATLTSEGKMHREIAVRCRDAQRVPVRSEYTYMDLNGTLHGYQGPSEETKGLDAILQLIREGKDPRDVQLFSVVTAAAVVAPPCTDMSRSGAHLPSPPTNDVIAYDVPAALGFLALGMKYQSGILRTNCVDCLDRTNVAQVLTIT